MDNNMYPPVNQVPQPTAPVPVPSNKFWKGFWIGILTVAGLLVLAGIGLFIFFTMVIAPSVTRGLEDARTKGAAAAVKANLASVRAEAEMVWDGSYDPNTGKGSYAAVCEDDRVVSLLSYARNSAVQGDVVCKATDDTWIAGASIKEAGETVTFCVDGQGTAATYPGTASEYITDTRFSCGN